MNKIRFGHCELSVSIWLMAVFFQLLVFLHPLPFTFQFLLIMNIVVSGIAILWLPMLIGKYHLRPGIDKCGKNETTWMRCTLDRILIPQFVDKGPYGQTMGVTYGAKADVIDDGEFPCKWLNGNSAVIMYDGMNTSIDLRKSVARKQMKKEYGVRDGVDAYNLAKKEGKTLHDSKG